MLWHSIFCAQSAIGLIQVMSVCLFPFFFYLSFEITDIRKDSPIFCDF